VKQSEKRRRIWVWTEHHRDQIARVALGLLGRARELGQQLGHTEVAAVLVGTDSPRLAEELLAHGADRVYVAGKPSLFQTEGCADLMTRLVQRYQPEIVLWGATSLGQDIAARVAARLDTGLTAHCIDLQVQEMSGEPQLVATVAGWGGNLALKIICPDKRPQMATVKPGIFSLPAPKERQGEVILLKEGVDVAPAEPRLDIVEVVAERDETSPLEQAATVVAGGWGLVSCGGFKLVEELAQVLGGKVGGTRPALDAGWISAEQMIGQSGKTIAPRLLITLGISGAAQFTTSILNSRFILAIDRNPEAPIFEMADIGIVGELPEVLPLLIGRLKAIKGQTL
jgi:electron transfer flavoprotein alpha subunit